MTFSDGHGEKASTMSRLNANGRYNDFYSLDQFTRECQTPNIPGTEFATEFRSKITLRV